MDERISFGPTSRDYFICAGIGAVLGTVGVALALYFGTRPEPCCPHEPQLQLLPMIWALFAFGSPAALWLSCCLTLRVAEGRVDMMLFGRFRLYTGRTGEVSLLRLRPGHCYPVVLHFRDGSRMRLFGVLPSTARRLREYFEGVGVPVQGWMFSEKA